MRVLVPQQGDRNLHIDFLELEGPIGAVAEPTAFEARFFDGCSLDAGKQAKRVFVEASNGLGESCTADP